MDFLFGCQNIDKTTCLIHLANQYIINNNIKSNDGYILLFTPPFSPNSANDVNTQRENAYNFVQHFTSYCPENKDNVDLIKCYALSNFEKSCDLITNFRLLSKEIKGLKLILIDDLTSIINRWMIDINSKRKDKIKKEDRSINETNKNLLLIYNQVFQYFLSQISILQKCYQVQCLITINLDPSNRIHFSKNAPRIFNAIFPFIRSSFLFQKSDEENQIDFEEVMLSLNMKNNKIEFSEFKQNENNLDFRDKFLDELINKKEKKSKNKTKQKELDEDWIKKAIGDFVEKINDYKKKQIENIQKNKGEDDSSLTQV